MNQSNTQPTPPKGVIESLSLGFETTASRPGVVLLPVALDLFIWLGPRLSIQPIMDRFVALLATAPTSDAASVESQKVLIEFFSVVGERTNVFALLSTAPLGVPSLMAALLPAVVPGGEPAVILLGDAWQFVLLTMSLSLIGVLLGAIYFCLIGSAIASHEQTVPDLIRQFVMVWAKFVAFSLLAIFFAALGSVPPLLMVGVLQLISPELGSIGVALWAALALWFFLYIGFSPHSIVLRGRGVLGSIWDSIRIVHRNIGSVIGLSFIIFVLNWGLGYVWSLPSADSWLSLAAIGGHAFVATGLMMATFIYFQDRYRWWLELQAIKT